MDLRAIIAIIRRDRLEPVEESLRDLGIRGITVSKVKGYGEYHNFFASDWMMDSVRIEIFTREDRVEDIRTAIVEAAHTGSPGDGIVVVYPVAEFLNIRLKSDAIPDAA